MGTRMDYILMGEFALHRITISKAENDFLRRWHNDLSCLQGWHPYCSCWLCSLVPGSGAVGRHLACFHGVPRCQPCGSSDGDSTADWSWSWKGSVLLQSAGCPCATTACASYRSASLHITATWFAFTQTKGVCICKQCLTWTLSQCSVR